MYGASRFNPENTVVQVAGPPFIIVLLMAVAIINITSMILFFKGKFDDAEKR